MKKKIGRQTIEFLTLWACVMLTGNALAQHHGASGHGDAPIVLDEVVVTARQIQDYIKNHPQQVVVVTREKIRQGGFRDMSEVLDAVPGVEVKKSGSGFGSRISIRGSGSSGKILILINGRPAGGSQYGIVELDSIPLDMVSRVDVFKPPVPVWLGPGGTAGAVNIVLANESVKDQERSKNTRVTIDGGSYGKAGVSVSRLMVGEGGKLRLTAVGNHRDGRRANSDRDSGNMSLQWDLPSKGITTYDINARYFQSENGSAGPTYNLTPDARQSYQKGAFDFRMKGMLWQTGDYNLKTYVDMIRLEDESQYGFTSTLDALTIGLKNETGFNAKDNSRALRIIADLARDHIDHTLSGEHNREKASIGLQGDQSVKAVTITLGGRCDYTSDFNFQPAVNSGLGIKLSPKSLVKINIGYGVNVPSFSQLYQPSHGSIDQVRGNPDLQEESVWTVTTGITFDGAKGRRLEATLFHEDTDDKIVYQDGEDLIKKPVNIDGAYRRGLELSAGWEMTPMMRTDISYVWQQSQNRENDKNLTYTPEHKFKVKLNWRLPTETRLETTALYVSRHYSDLENTSEKSVSGYTTFDLKMIQPIYFKTCRTEWVLYIENLLDRDYETHYGYPDDGFRFTLGFNVDF